MLLEYGMAGDPSGLSKTSAMVTPLGLCSRPTFVVVWRAEHRRCRLGREPAWAWSFPNLTRSIRPDLASVQGAPLPSLSGSAAPRCVNVQEAKTHLSALLARVAAGERIV